MNSLATTNSVSLEQPGNVMSVNSGFSIPYITGEISIDFNHIEIKRCIELKTHVQERRIPCYH